MNRDNNNSWKLHNNSWHKDDQARDLKTLNMPNLTVQSAVGMMRLRDAAIATTEKKNDPISVEQLLKEIRDPAIRKQRRMAGMKRRAELSTSLPTKDNRYRTMHPNKLTDQRLFDGSDHDFIKKSKRIKHELSKQEDMIESQGHGVTKKYQLMHSDLGKLLRSISEGNSNGNANGIPTRDGSRRIIASS